MNILIPERYDLPQLKSDFKQNGYVLLKGFRSQNELSSLQQRLREFIRDEVPHLPPDKVFYDDLGNLASLKQIQKLFEHDKYFHVMMFQSSFESLARELLGTEVRGINMQYFDKPTRTSLPTPPHQDGYYFMLEPNEAVTMWLALDATNEENGCVRYIPGSHRSGMRNHQPTNTLGFSQGISDYGEDDYASELVVEAEPGDLLVHHALTIHRADRNQSLDKSRRAIGLIYYSVDAVESPAKEQRQAELFQSLAAKGKI